MCVGLEEYPATVLLAEIRSKHRENAGSHINHIKEMAVNREKRGEKKQERGGAVQPKLPKSVPPQGVSRNPLRVRRLL